MHEPNTSSPGCNCFTFLPTASTARAAWADAQDHHGRHVTLRTDVDAAWAAELLSMLDQHHTALRILFRRDPDHRGRRVIRLFARKADYRRIVGNDAGGMYVYSPACLRVLRALADRHGLLLILDEIATGFGRTGQLFAAGHAWPPAAPDADQKGTDQVGADGAGGGHVGAARTGADIVCVGKALTGGYLTMAAVLCTERVAAGVDASPPGALTHGPTFMANPLACAIAAANLDLLARGYWREQVAGIEAGLRAGLGELRDETLRLDNHQVGIEREGGSPADIGDHFGAKRDCRDKTTIHHVKVDPIGPCVLCAHHSGPYLREVCREDRRRCDSYARGHTPTIRYGRDDEKHPTLTKEAAFV